MVTPSLLMIFGSGLPEVMHRESYFFGKTQKCADAQGKEWKCGKAATKKLEQLINNEEVRCTDEGLDRYGRTSWHLLCWFNGFAV